MADEKADYRDDDQERGDDRTRVQARRVDMRQPELSNEPPPPAGGLVRAPPEEPPLDGVDGLGAAGGVADGAGVTGVRTTGVAGAGGA
ncbi:MAG: hypothetical protein JWO23_2721 [Solirubrobacterales bacterium]|jgi:hypothetical protein|nr:hypothetical protein [Solirubrobacterales bacterium]